MDFARPPPPQRTCHVCTAKADSAHFGVDSCRACAAFFRRTVLLNKKYICRQSTQSCDVSKEVRFTCRRCRFVKCIEVGMNPDSVPTAPNLRVSDADIEPALMPQKPLLHHHHKSESETFEGGSSQTGLIDTITEQYRLLEELAMHSDEYVMTQAFGESLPRRNGHLPATIGLLNQMARASHQPTIDFTTNCFPEMAEFDDDEKWLVLKNFMTSRFIFDGVHRARQVFPGDDRIFMVTFATFLDIDNVDFYLSDLEATYDKQSSVRIMREMTTKCTSDWLGPLLARANIDEVETMAIYGLLCWPSYLSNASSRVMEVCYKYHLRIFQELHQHYRVTGQTNFSRVAHITSILLCVQAAIQRLKEDMQIYRLLDVYSGHELVYNVVK